MITKFGPKVNGIQIGFQYEGFEFSKDGKKARITKPRVVIIRDVRIVEQSNTLYVSSLGILKQKDNKINTYHNTNCSGKGRKVIKRLTGEWITLDSKRQVRKLFHVQLDDITYVEHPLSVNGYIAYPFAKSD